MYTIRIHTGREGGATFMVLSGELVEGVRFGCEVDIVNPKWDHVEAWVTDIDIGVQPFVVDLTGHTVGGGGLVFQPEQIATAVQHAAMTRWTELTQ